MTRQENSSASHSFGIMKSLALCFLVLYGVRPVFAQSDSLVFKNGDVMVGELKSMDRGVAVVSTKYSDSDFKVTWLLLRRLYARKSYTCDDIRRSAGCLATSHP